MSVDASRIVTQARSWKGQHEQPMGSNRGLFVEACQHATWLAGTGWPWCAGFVCRVCQVAGVPLTGANSAGAHDLANRHRQNWVSDKWQWRAGMVVDYNVGSGHTGIVTAINVGAGTVTSCDGNWADAVTEHVMPMSSIRAVWKIPGVVYYSDAPQPAPHPVPKRLPAFVVATSASGHRKVLFTSAAGKAGKKSLVAWLVGHNLARLAPSGITITRGKAQ